MTSVDSGVETGNDSNDSAQTENHSNNQGFIKSGSITNSMDTQLQAIQKPESDVTEVDMRMLPTSTIICRPENSLSFTSQNNLGAESPGPVLVFNLGSGATKTLQFKTPPQFLIHPKLWKRSKISHVLALGINYPKSFFRNDAFEEELKPVSVRVSSVQRSKRQELRSVPFCKIGGNPWWGRKMRMAAATNNIELMQRLLEKGVSPNNHDEQGRSPLHLASCRGYTEMVKLLLDYGANPNQIDCIGNTPLHLAAVTSKGSVVKLLLNAGTNVCSSDRHGYNPLQLAQTKLRMLQNCNGSDMNRVKDEVHKIVGMLLTYLQKQKDACEQIETLTSFCSRISLSNTTNQVQDDVKDLLASIDALSLTN